MVLRMADDPWDHSNCAHCVFKRRHPQNTQSSSQEVLAGRQLEIAGHMLEEVQNGAFNPKLENPRKQERIEG